MNDNFSNHCDSSTSFVALKIDKYYKVIINNFDLVRSHVTEQKSLASGIDQVMYLVHFFKQLSPHLIINLVKTIQI